MSHKDSVTKHWGNTKAQWTLLVSVQFHFELLRDVLWYLV